MYLTLRGVLLLLLFAPLWAAMEWTSGLEWTLGIFVLICLGLFLYDWISAGKIDRFQVLRQMDGKLSLGAQNPIHIHVHNNASRSTTFHLRDEPPTEFEVQKWIHDGEVAARGTWQDLYYVRPLRRGDYTFGNMHLRWQGPLGLIVRQSRIEAETPVKVYPNLLDIHRYDMLLRRNRLQEMGLRHSRQFGQGTEFESLREYSPDDEYRRINWKATARRYRPITTEYETERSQNVMCILDVGRMMQSPVGEMAKLDFAINTVLMLSYVATSKGDKVGLMTFADRVIHFLSPRHGKGQFHRMIERLYAIEAQPVEPDYPHAFNYLALKQRKRALMIIFSDLSGGISMQSLVTHAAVLAERNLLLIVTISDPDVHDASKRIPRDSLQAYQRAAAMRLLDERSLTLEMLHKRGVQTLDVPANQLSVAVINRYLELKGKVRL
jgi:uncharacterized protein (DUF58 family)